MFVLCPWIVIHHVAMPLASHSGPMIRRGFTLIEVLIVVVIMAVLAAAVLPYFGDTTSDAKAAGLRMNLRLMREQLSIYKAQHNGKLPSATLAELMTRTDMNGVIGTGVDHIYGPYLPKMPLNTFTGNSSVKSISNHPPTGGDVTANLGGGWLYHAATGSLFADHPAYFSE